MRDQTIVMHAAGAAREPIGIMNVAREAIFEGAYFVLALGISYLAVCYGVHIPTPEIFEESHS
jgi:hypothetical protein